MRWRTPERIRDPLFGMPSWVRRPVRVLSWAGAMAMEGRLSQQMLAITQIFVALQQALQSPVALQGRGEAERS